MTVHPHRISISNSISIRVRLGPAGCSNTLDREGLADFWGRDFNFPTPLFPFTSPWQMSGVRWHEA